MKITKCPIAKRCNGCQLQNLEYEKQLIYKQNKMKKYLGKFGDIPSVIGMEEPCQYRNKAQFTFRRLSKDKIIAGIYQSKTGGIASTQYCLLDNPIADEISKTICKLLISFKIKVYDNRNDSGYFKHLLVRTSDSTHEIMVVLVAKSNNFPSKTSFVNALLEKHPEITTITLNVNNNTKMMLGEYEEILYGNGYITDYLCDKKFRISSNSFYQINSVQTEKLYKKAISLAHINKNDNVLDAYCGVGTISIILSDFAKNVIGVEINSDAVKDAIKNAKANDIKNVYFYKDDAGRFLTEYRKSNNKFDAVFIDPPRAGCSKQFINDLVKYAPKKVVYISCNIETQERDVSYLVRNGYLVKEIQGYDMFPHTNHIESVMLLTHI